MQRKAPLRRPVFISHRGESAVAPENTLAAFRYAMEGDSDGMETDVHLTSDGVVVCAHDSNLKRVFGEDVVIEEHTLAELRRLTALPHAEQYPHETVPTLAEALLLLRPGKLFFIEVKGDDSRVADAMVEEVRKAGVASEQIVVIAFSAEVIRHVHKTYPEYRTLWLMSFARDAATGAFLHDTAYYLDILKDIGADGIDCHANLDFVDKAFCRALHDAGMEIAVWTVDDAAAGRQLMLADVDAITSNCALALRKALLPARA